LPTDVQLRRRGEDYSAFYNAFAGHVSLSEWFYPQGEAKALATESELDHQRRAFE
jgi:hypothetical protein